MIVVVYIFAGLLTIFGLTALIRLVAVEFFKSKCPNRLIHIIVLNNDEPELSFRESLEQLHWYNLATNDFVVVVDKDLDQINREIATKLCSSHNLPLFDQSEFAKILEFSDLNNGDT